MTSRVSHTCDMTTNDRTITEQLPDLPALESAEAGTGHTWPIAAVMLGILFLIVGGAIWFLGEYRQYLGQQTGLMYAVTAVSALASLWLIVGLVIGDYHWKTTSEGLFARSILRRRFVRWSDVRQASSRQSSLRSCPAYKLRTSAGRFEVYPASTYPMIMLYTSVWQHLRRAGMADGLALPVLACSIWDRIPDELPREMDWTDTRPPRLWPYIAVPAVFTAGVLWFSATAVLEGQYFIAVLMLLFSSILPITFASVLREVRSSAKQVSLREDRLAAVTGRGALTLPWSEVTQACWGRDSDSGGMRIVIRGGTPSCEVGIPYRPSDEGSARLVLAVIRRLRTASVPQALFIPDELHAAPDTLAGDEALRTGPVVLRLTWAERIGAAFPGVPIVMLASLFFVDKPDPNPWHIVIPTAVAYGVGLLLSGSYRVSADDQGISKRFLFWSKSVLWENVVGYSVFEMRPASVREQRLLIGKDGRMLMSIAPGVRPQSDRRRFLAYVHARLAEVLPDDVLNPPWKARPWTPP